MRYLIIRLSALGDVVTASPVPRLIKQHEPDAEVVWAVEQRCAAAVQGHPWVDEVVVLPSSKQWREWLRRGRLGQCCAAVAELSHALRRRPFDVVLDLQGLFKSGLLAGLARGRRKILPADAYEALPFLFTDIVPRHTSPDHISTMYTSLLEPLGIRPRGPEDLRLVFPIGDGDRATVAGWLAARGLVAGGFVALVPGTTRPQKLWPTDSWAPLAARLHRELGLPAVIVGGPSERGLAEQILKMATSPVHDAAGATTVPETGALLAAARLAVTVDTGPMHIAVAVGCPTVALFGSTEPRRFRDGSPHVVLHRHFACSPCLRHPTCRHYECLAAIRPGDVARAARRLLEASAT